MNFYPNECFICKTKKNLRQCTRCQMISYCGKKHQDEHTNHKELCKAIVDQTKIMKVIHLYEKFHKSNINDWCKMKENFHQIFENKLGRSLSLNEIQMLYFPRSCFICHQSKQELLINCPNCPSLSYCNEHKDLRQQHINECGILSRTQNFDSKKIKIHEILKIAQLIVERIFFDDNNKMPNQPKSMAQLLQHYPKPTIDINELTKISISDILTYPLTIYNGFYKLKFITMEKLTIFLHQQLQEINEILWEIILHLMQDLKILQIIIHGSNDNVKIIDTCNNCKRNNKKLIIITMKNYEKSLIISDVIVNFCFDNQQDTSIKMKRMEKIDENNINLYQLSKCPIIYSGYKEIEIIRKNLEIDLSKIIIHYDGVNKFCSLQQRRDCRTELNYVINSNMLIFQYTQNSHDNTNLVKKYRDEFLNDMKTMEIIENKEIKEKITNSPNDELNLKENKIDKKLTIDSENKTKVILMRKTDAIHLSINENKKIVSLTEKKMEISLEKIDLAIMKKLSKKTEDQKVNQIQNTPENLLKMRNIILLHLFNEKKLATQNSLKENKLQTSIFENNVENSNPSNSENLLNEKKIENSSNEKNMLELIFNHDDLNYYEIDSCQVCHLSRDCVPCTRCKIISYCSDSHRREHWTKHKDFCKVILGMLKESGGTTLYDKSKTNYMDAWIKIKVNFLVKAQTKLVRQLFDYEKQVILFPRTCFICHESDRSILKTCECGTSLCKQHKNNSTHKKICSDLQTAVKFEKMQKLLRQYPKQNYYLSRLPENAMENILIKNKIKKLPTGMTAFIESNSIKEIGLSIYGENDKFKKCLITEYFSRPLTALYAIEKLNMPVKKSLIIHIIGASKNDLLYNSYWEILLHWLIDLKEIKIHFFGPKFDGNYCINNELCNSCKAMDKKSFQIYCYSMNYHESLNNKSIVTKPDIIFGFNLNLHESDYGIYECKWKETFCVLKNYINIPFIMTSETERRGQKDHEKLCSFLEKSVIYDFFQENPFASSIMMRDFETEQLKNPNKFLLIYKQFYKTPNKSAISLETKNESFKQESEILNKNLITKNATQMLTVGELEKIHEKQMEEEKVTMEKFNESLMQTEINSEHLIKKTKQINEQIENLPKSQIEIEMKKSQETNEKLNIKLSENKLKSQVITKKEEEEKDDLKNFKTDAFIEEKKNFSENSLEKLNTSTTKTISMDSLMNTIEELNQSSYIQRKEEAKRQVEFLRESFIFIHEETLKMKQENLRLREENKLLIDIRSEIEETLKKLLEKKNCQTCDNCQK